MHSVHSCSRDLNDPLEYYHMDRCPDCKLTDPLIADLESAYDGALAIEWIDVETVDGWERWNAYAFLEVPAVVVDGTFKIPKEEITKESLRAAIEQSLAGAEPQENSPPIEWDIPLAYSLGLFSGFSPCLMAILGFILVYVTGSGKGLRSNLLNSVIFGLGLVAAYIILGCCFLLAGMSLGGFGPYLAIAAGIITILAGVNLLGLIRLPVSHRQLCQVIHTKACDHPCRVVHSGHDIFDRQGPVCCTDDPRSC